ncbi:XRE family transcriptional regulator, partial [Bacteroides fragilis]
MNEQQLFIKIGDKIKEIRLSKNMSQQDLAANATLKSQYVTELKQGVPIVTIKNAY